MSEKPKTLPDVKKLLIALIRSAHKCTYISPREDVVLVWRLGDGSEVSIGLNLHSFENDGDIWEAIYSCSESK
ncbi:MAG: hypothetical protein JHC33_05795 [Ignisphaera sp.]|nr:hypothetical protein [Ignisphaera sp.]